MWVSTFHSACVRILRRDADKLGFPSQFTIYDQADAVRLTGYVIRDLGLDTKRFPPRSVHAAISAAKNDGLDAEAYAARAGNLFERKIADVFREYQARLLRAGAMDFDDLLGQAAAPAARAPRRARSTTSAGSSTSWSTSTRTRTGSRTTASCCSPPTTATSASSATRTSACRPARRCRHARPGRGRSRRSREGDEVLGVGAGGRAGRQSRHRRHGRAATGAGCTRCTPAAATLRGTPHHVVLADPALDAGPPRRLPDGAHRPGLPRRADQERAPGRPRPARAGPARPHQPGARRPGVDPPGLRQPGRGGVLGGVLRRRRTACRPRCSTGSGATWPWTTAGSSGCSPSSTRGRRPRS